MLLRETGLDAQSMGLDDYVYWERPSSREKGCASTWENFRRRMFDQRQPQSFWSFNDTWPDDKQVGQIVDYYLRRTPGFWAHARQGNDSHQSRGP